ncbi:hypothetical protein E2C01_073313 [Portunus trituberculatus]|uniref:Uncharacterized protein n=1 Tax=Portunus trituberculatus TaxID=210409 RepID=A0A5B7I9H6_PORTR|nr:hypothetical protein [Portunus trituberculatus]
MLDLPVLAQAGMLNCCQVWWSRPQVLTAWFPPASYQYNQPGESGHPCNFTNTESNQAIIYLVQANSKSL